MKQLYVCDKEHCSNSCPGHFDQKNNPACQWEDGTKIRETRGKGNAISVDQNSVVNFENVVIEND